MENKSQKEIILVELDELFDSITFNECEFKLRDPEECGMLIPIFSRINKNIKIMKTYIEPERYNVYKLTPLYIKMDEYIFYAHMNPIMKLVTVDEWKILMNMKKCWEIIDTKFNNLIFRLENVEK